MDKKETYIPVMPLEIKDNNVILGNENYPNVKISEPTNEFKKMGCCYKTRCV